MTTALEPWTPRDSLGEALHQLRMNGAFYCHSDLTAPWGFTVPAMVGHLWFHLVTSGVAWLEVPGNEARYLQRGDLVLVNHGSGHSLRSALGVPAPSVADLPKEIITPRYDVLRYGGGGAPTTFVCGAVRFDAPAARHLVASLPDVIHVQPEGPYDTGWVPATLSLMAAEAKELRPGGEAVITRLADILVIQAIRTWIRADAGANRGWLGALRDEYIGRAISLVHRDPARPWTLAALAQEVAMSRSAFAARFSALVGEPPMHYVTRWRMYLALDVLEGSGATVNELAGRLGYRSEAAFARAFKRVIGVSPGAVKRSAGP
ncbi:AraC family transcriptional regulator [Pseudonocardia sp. TRM90224]|uniref:AraC family transcriptional regulator n=1 Tax=Pseudonocardia sp. TRM90224 TaxID=2812678 RepID=UPI001E2C7664|nr:AraC family transcriptional regulator [Pseudonocardia sp. TRM90224]